MSTQTRLRRGTTTQHQSFTGAEGEVTVDTTKDVVVVHDGSTAGGVPMARQDRPRGWTKLEHFTSSGTWTKAGKTDLKRIRVTIWGGGGGGGSNNSGGGGGGQGGYGYIMLEASQLSTNVSVTVGGAGSNGGGAGGQSAFGSYIYANGGVGGSNSNAGNGGNPGTISGSGAIELGGEAGSSGSYSATANANYGWVGGAGGGPGAGRGQSARGVCGGGGGCAGAGAQGSVMIEEIYGDV
jgi:hypothetical protein